MGGQTDQSSAAASSSAAAASASQQFQNLSFPAISQVIAQYMSDLGGPGTEPESVKKLFSQARDNLGQSFNSAELSTSSAIATRAKSMGLDYRPDALQSAQNTAQQGLERQRASALQNLSFQETGAGMNQTNTLLAQMGQIERGLGGSALGFGQAANQDLAYLNNQNPWGSALGGAAAGAGAGASFGPWGAVIGGVAGGALGYFGSGG